MHQFILWDRTLFKIPVKGGIAVDLCYVAACSGVVRPIVTIPPFYSIQGNVPVFHSLRETLLPKNLNS